MNQETMTVIEAIREKEFLESRIKKLDSHKRAIERAILGAQNITQISINGFAIPIFEAICMQAETASMTWSYIVQKMIDTYVDRLGYLPTKKAENLKRKAKDFIGHLYEKNCSQGISYLYQMANEIYETAISYGVCDPLRLPFLILEFDKAPSEFMAQLDNLINEAQATTFITVPIEENISE